MRQYWDGTQIKDAEMNINHYECGSLSGPIRSLLEGSGLVPYCGHSFVCNGDGAALESWWREKFDAKFGRYMAWVWFSVGAENLAKAALVCHGLLEAKHQNYSYPVYWGDTDKGSWIEKVLGSRRNAGGGYGEMEKSGETSLMICPTSSETRRQNAKS